MQYGKNYTGLEWGCVGTGIVWQVQLCEETAETHQHNQRASGNQPQASHSPPLLPRPTTNNPSPSHINTVLSAPLSPHGRRPVQITPDSTTSTSTCWTLFIVQYYCRLVIMKISITCIIKQCCKLILHLVNLKVLLKQVINIRNA